MILLRHGQSEFNVAFNATRVDPGIPDPRLTEEGRRQARAAAVALAAHPVERLIASPYTRALETAEIVAGELGLPIEVHLLVREHCLFHCDIGSPRSTLAAALARRWISPIWRSAGGRISTRPRKVSPARAQAFRRSMTGDPLWQRTAIVSHWGFIRALTGLRVPNGHLLRFDPHSGEAKDLMASDVAEPRRT